MQIKLASVPIDDYDKALKFYTEVLGFVRAGYSPPEKAPLSHGRFAGKTRMAPITP